MGSQPYSTRFVNACSWHTADLRAYAIKDEIDQRAVMYTVTPAAEVIRRQRRLLEEVGS